MTVWPRVGVVRLVVLAAAVAGQWFFTSLSVPRRLASHVQRKQRLGPRTTTGSPARGRQAIHSPAMTPARRAGRLASRETRCQSLPESQVLPTRVGPVRGDASNAPNVPHVRGIAFAYARQTGSIRRADLELPAQHKRHLINRSSLNSRSNCGPGFRRCGMPRDNPAQTFYLIVTTRTAACSLWSGR